MKEVRYLNGRKGLRRVLRPIDLHRMGIPNQRQELVWDPANRFTLVMGDDLSDSIVARLPSEFVAIPVTGGNEPLDTDDSTTSLAQSASSDPEDDPNSSLGDPDDDDESSTGDDDPDE